MLSEADFPMYYIESIFLLHRGRLCTASGMPCQQSDITLKT